MKRMIWIVGLLLCASLVTAIDSSYVFKHGDDVIFNIPVISNNETLVTSDTNCTMTIVRPDGTILVDKGNMSFLSDGLYQYNISQAEVNKKGEYQASMACTNGVDAGFSTFGFDINTEGTRFTTIVLLWVILAVLYALLIIAVIYKEITLGSLASLGMIVMGVYVTINGIGDVDNMLTLAFGTIHWAVGIYLLIRSNMESAMESL